MPKISIIIPVYNVELYIRRCLDSVLLQTFTDYECILVDDASPDNSPLICDEYAGKDIRFKVIHKLENEGLPKARKTGIDIALGEFIVHVDSDDWIEEKALEMLLSKQRETNADIVIGGFKFIFNRWDKISVPLDTNKYRFSLDWFFSTNGRALWGKLYRKKCFEKYQVPGYSIGEGSMVNVQIFAHCDLENIAIVNDVIYNYNRRNVNSMMLKRKKKYVSNSMFEHPCIKNCMWIKRYLESLNLYDAVKISFLKYMFGFMCVYLIEVNKPQKKDIDYMYNETYLPFASKYKISFFKRTLMTAHRKSIFFGRIFVALIRMYHLLRNGNIISGG